jgi:hypothetical protein
MKPKGLAKTLLTGSALTAAFTLISAPVAHAVNAAWNTNAATGNFNTAQWTSGTTTPVAGGTYTVVSGDALFFGTSTTTTLNNDLVGATYNGLTFNSGASAFTIGGNAFTLNGNITNSSTSLQTINNDMTSTGGRTFTGGTGGLTLGGTYTTTVSATYNGVVNLTGANTINGGSTANQGFATVGNNTSATVTISNGGSLTVNGTTNATKPGTIIGQNTNGIGILNVGATNGSTSGTLTVSGDTGFMLGNVGAGTLNIYSGTATINRGTTATTTNGADTRLIMLGRDGNSASGTINLNGGTLATNRQFVRDGSSSAGAGTANFVFNGGTLKALANQTDWLQSTTATSEGQNLGASGGTVNTNALALSSVTTTSANSTIDSNGFSVAINNNISGSGGFNVISSTGAGTVTFGGANTYTGATTVTSGTFALASAGSLASTQLNVSTGATFNVSAVSGGYQVGNGVTLTNNGTVTGSFTVGNGGTLKGTGTVTGNLTVASGGNVAPGNSPGVTTVNGNFDLQSGSTFNVELAGTSPGVEYDQLFANGTVTLAGALNLTASFTPTNGDLFFILVNDGADAISGTFTGLNEGSTFTVGGQDYQITYQANFETTPSFTGGNDVALLAVPEPAAALLGGLGMLGLLRRRRVA